MPTPKSIRPLAAAFCCVVILLACSGQDEPASVSDVQPEPINLDLPDLATGQAVPVLAQLTADPDNEPLLDDCPLDPLGALLREALVEVDSRDVIRGLRGDFESSVYVYEDESAPTFVVVACSNFGVDTGEGFGLDAAVAPDEFSIYLDSLLGPEPDIYAIEQLPSVDHRGGRFERFCARDLELDEASFCEVTWLNDDILITLYVSGGDSDLDDLEPMQAGLASVLDRVVENLVSFVG